MSRASIKPDLIQSANNQFNKLWKLVDSMTDDERNAVIDFSEAPGKEAHWGRDKNMRDGGGRDTEKDLFGKEGGYCTVLSSKTLAYPCRACGSGLKREAFLGGNIYYCPVCQPL